MARLAFFGVHDISDGFRFVFLFLRVLVVDCPRQHTERKDGGRRTT